jgi:Ni/Co efflux regulator RcnB
MKKIMLAASAALMIAGPGAGFAQDQEHQGRPGGARPAAPPAAPQGHPAPQPGGAAPTYHQPNFGAGNYRPQVNSQPNASQPANGRPPYNAPTGAAPVNGQAPMGGRAPFNGQPGAQPNVGGPRFPGGQGGYRPQPGQPGVQGGASGGGGFRGGYHGQAGPPAGWRGPGPGAQSFNYGGRQFYRYRVAPYAFPRGYYGWTGHAWRRGEWLPSVFIMDTYFINDWYDFGLYDPAYGYEWIRVGADALLVDLATGQVVDVVPGVYYW